MLLSHVCWYRRDSILHELLVRGLTVQPDDDLAACVMRLRSALHAEEMLFAVEDSRLSQLTTDLGEHLPDALRVTLKEESSTELKHELRTVGLDTSGSFEDLWLRVNLWNDIEYKSHITMGGLRPQLMTDAQLEQELAQRRIELPARVMDNSSAARIREERIRLLGSALTEEMHKGPLK